MEIRGDLITDFLDLPPHERREGLYFFDPQCEIYFSDIPEDTFYHKIRRPATGDEYGIIEVYLSDISVFEVFSTTKASIPTYVSRDTEENLTYEASILSSLQEPGRTLVLYGPSKLGKSALWSYIIGSDCISISCTPSLTANKLYDQVLYEIENPYASGASRDITDEAEQTEGVSVSIGKKDIGQAQFGKSRSKKHLNGRTRNFKYSERPVSAESVSKELYDKNYALIFENHHRLKPSVLKELCYDIRTFADQNVTTIFVGIPNEPFDIINYNPELMGRTSFLKFNYWNPDELREIAIGGGKALNVSLSEETLGFLTHESAGSPLLMQLYSLIACLASGVTRTQEQFKDVELDQKDFELALNKWGIEILRPCELICEILKKECDAVRSIPDNFTSVLFDHLKQSGPTLFINCYDLSFWPLQTRTINALTKRLNRREITKDLLTFNERACTLNIGNPFFISYVKRLRKI